MDGAGKRIVAQLGVEGGGATVYRSEVEGLWSFWHEGTAMNFDETDDEVWRDWKCAPVAELSLALPNIWWVMIPIASERDFVAWFRDAYERRPATPVNRAAVEGWRRLLGLSP